MPSSSQIEFGGRIGREIIGAALPELVERRSEMAKPEDKSMKDHMPTKTPLAAQGSEEARVILATGRDLPIDIPYLGRQGCTQYVTRS